MVDKRIQRINKLVTELNPGQIGMEPTVDSDLNFKMSGGKNYDGTAYKDIIKDNPARLAWINFLEDDYSVLSGTVWRNTTDSCLSYKINNDVTIKLGLSKSIYVYNDTGTQINKGTVVRVLSAANNTPLITVADKDQLIPATSIIALTLQDIADSDYGFVTTDTLAYNLNTTSYTIADDLWLSDDGGLITTQPNAPAKAVFIGNPIRIHATAGTVLTRPIVIPGITELSDVDKSSSPSNNQAPVWNATNSRFEFIDVTTGGVQSLSSNDNDEQLMGDLRITEGANILIDKLDDDTGFQISSNIAALVYFADSITVDVGTVNGGDVDSTKIPHDNDELDVQELVNTPGFSIILDYINVANFDLVGVYLKYNGEGASHICHIQLYNYVTTTWDNITDFALASTWQLFSIVVQNAANYINGSDQSRVRIYHDSEGLSTHSILVDYCVLRQSSVGSATGVISVNGKSGVLTLTAGDSSISVTSGGTYDIDIKVVDVDESLITGLVPDQLVFGNSDGTVGQAAGLEYNVVAGLICPYLTVVDPAVPSIIGYFNGYGNDVRTAAYAIGVGNNARLIFRDDILDDTVTWTGRFADTNTEVDDFLTSFGDVSILQAFNTVSTLSATWTENLIVLGDASGGLEQSTNLSFTDTQLVVNGGYVGHDTQGTGIFTGGVLGTAAGFSDQYVDSSEWSTLGSESKIKLFSSSAQWTEAYQFLSDSVGSIWDLISTAATLGGTGGTLDDAYRYGGDGTTITADIGSVAINGPTAATSTMFAINRINTSTLSELVSWTNNGADSCVSLGLHGTLGTTDSTSTGHIIQADGATMYKALFDGVGTSYLHFNTIISNEIYHIPQIQLYADDLSSLYSGIQITINGIFIDGDTVCNGYLNMDSNSISSVLNIQFGSTPTDIISSSGTCTVNLKTGKQIQSIDMTEAISSVILTNPGFGIGTYYLRVYTDTTRGIGNFSATTPSTSVTWIGNYDLNAGAYYIPSGTSILIMIQYLGIDIGYLCQLVAEV